MPEDDPAASRAHLQRIAEGSIQLAALVPKMAEVAENMRAQADEQARAASAAAEAAGALAAALESAVRELDASSKQMAEALLTVRRIADHTRILSINASIEAARAGAWGKTFGVVVEEVKQLADTTTDTTLKIESEVSGMQERVARVAAVAGLGEASADSTIGAVNRKVRGMAASARRQLDGAESLHHMGERIEGLAEDLLLAVGRFRFEAHAYARAALEEALPALAGAGLDGTAAERTLSDWLLRHGYFELAYATDAAGRQFVDNLACGDGRIVRDASARGRVWVDRPWYREACRSAGVCVTDLYRSAATRDFCFTVAAAWRDGRHAVAGVVAADVNFHKLMVRRGSLAAHSCLA